MGVVVILVLNLETLLLQLVVVEELIDAAKVCVLLILDRFYDLFFRSLLQSRYELENFCDY